MALEKLFYPQDYHHDHHFFDIILIFYKKSLASRCKMSIIAPLPRETGNGGTRIAKSGCSSVVERNLAKVDVVGSNPIIRSPKKHADVAQW